MIVGQVHTSDVTKLRYVGKAIAKLWSQAMVLFRRAYLRQRRRAQRVYWYNIWQVNAKHQLLLWWCYGIWQSTANQVEFLVVGSCCYSMEHRTYEPLQRRNCSIRAPSAMFSVSQGSILSYLAIPAHAMSANTCPSSYRSQPP